MTARLLLASEFRLAIGAGLCGLAAALAYRALTGRLQLAGLLAPKGAEVGRGSRMAALASTVAAAAGLLGNAHATGRISLGAGTAGSAAFLAPLAATHAVYLWRKARALLRTPGAP